MNTTYHKLKCYAFPGISGDDINFSYFRTELHEEFDFLVMEYPSAYSKTELLVDLEAIAETFATRITSDGYKAIALCGYSFGGCVGLEVARILDAMNIEIEMLLLIDPPIPGIVFDIHNRSLSHYYLPKRSLAKQWIFDLTYVINCTYRFRNINLTVLRLFGKQYRVKITSFIEKVLRERARRFSWKPKVTNFKTFLLISSEFKSSTEATLRQICLDAYIVNVEGRHARILARDNRYFILEEIKCFINEKILKNANRC